MKIDHTKNDAWSKQIVPVLIAYCKHHLTVFVVNLLPALTRPFQLAIQSVLQLKELENENLEF